MADRVVVDASTGEETTEPLTAEERAERDAEAAAALEADRIEASRQSNRVTLEQRAEQALQTNATYLALASPSNAQHFAQLRAVTQEASALIRLLLRRLDSTD